MRRDITMNASTDLSLVHTYSQNGLDNRRTYLFETGFCFAKEIILAKLRSTYFHEHHIHVSQAHEQLAHNPRHDFPMLLDISDWLTRWCFRMIA